MSEENAPKLRLKPKLGADPAAASAQPVAETPAAPVEPVPVAEEPKTFRLKPRLSAAPVEEPLASPEPEEPAPMPEPIPVDLDPVAEPIVEEKPVVKFSLKPRATATAPTPAPEAAPTEEIPIDPELSAPAAPTPVATDHGENGEPAEITAMRKASSVPFVAPKGKFPPPTSLPFPPPKTLSAPKPKASMGAGSKVMLVLGGVMIGGLIGVGAIVYIKLTTPPPAPAPEPRPKLVAKPPVEPAAVPAAAAVQTMVDQAKEAAVAPVNEVLASESPAQPAAVAVAPAVKPVDAPVAPTPTPAAVAPVPTPVVEVAAATPVFKAWVDNLKIHGVSVRAGKPTRVTIGSTAYVVGDLVEPKLGITLDGYDPATRMITFKDRSGAKVDKHN